MIQQLVPVDGKTLDWPRRVANAINALARNVLTLQQPKTTAYQPTTEPTDPVEGLAYYDSGTHKLRVYDGTTWQDAW